MTTPSSPAMSWMDDSLGVSIALSHADMARLQAENEQQAVNRAHAARTVAGYSQNAADCRLLLGILGLDQPDVQAAYEELHATHRSKPASTRATGRGTAGKRAPGKSAQRRGGSEVVGKRSAHRSTAA